MLKEIIYNWFKERKEVFNNTEENIQKNSSQSGARLLQDQDHNRIKRHIKSLIKSDPRKNSINSILAILFLIFSLSMISQINASKKAEFRELDDANNFIVLTIEGSGSQKIISEEYISPLPDSVKINENDEITEGINRVINLGSTASSNIVKLTWNTPLRSSRYMF